MFRSNFPKFYYSVQVPFLGLRIICGCYNDRDGFRKIFCRARSGRPLARRVPSVRSPVLWSSFDRQKSKGGLNDTSGKRRLSRDWDTEGTFYLPRTGLLLLSVTCIPSRSPADPDCSPGWFSYVQTWVCVPLFTQSQTVSCPASSPSPIELVPTLPALVRSFVLSSLRRPILSLSLPHKTTIDLRVCRFFRINLCSHWLYPASFDSTNLALTLSSLCHSLPLYSLCGLWCAVFVS